MTERIEKMLAIVKNPEVEIFPEGTKTYGDPMDLALPKVVADGKQAGEYIKAQTVFISDYNRFTGLLRFSGLPDDVPGDIFNRPHHKWTYALGWSFKHHLRDLCGCEWEHGVPDFKYILKNGMEKGTLAKIAHYKEKYRYERDKYNFLTAVEYVCNGVLDFADKCADTHEKAAGECDDAVRREELLTLADACRKVPRHPAENFYEALQCVMFCYQYQPDSIGTIDRYLYEYYKNDIDSGVLTREQAFDLLQEVLLYIASKTPHNDGDYEFSGECHFAVGGYTEFGEDGFTDFSRLIVEALMSLDTRKPQISLRWTKKTPYETLKFILDCERNDKQKRIALINDEPRIKSFVENCGLSFGQAVNYTSIGCNEIAFPGSIYLGGCVGNIGRSIVNTIYNRTDEITACESFEDFYAVFREELIKDLKEMLYWLDFYYKARSRDCNVISTFLLDGCIENGISGQQGGCSFKLGGVNIIGITSLIDSLSVIKQFVYDEKKTDMARLVKALESNWESDEMLHTEIINRGRFFGNNDPLSDEISRRITCEMHAVTDGYRTCFDAPVLFGSMAGYHPFNVRFGAMMPATPDGRYKGESYMVGQGQTRGKDRKGLSALMRSIAQMDPMGAMTGPVVSNMMVDEVMVRNDEYFEKLCRMVETYFRLGGVQVQLNHVSREELLEAREKPDEYKSLKVRVSGYSAPFVLLDKGIQNEIIERTVISESCDR